ncbi:Mur ligase family protein [Clostridium beijerinckii]|uniref:Mur ligase family protein n=1 Tax=Clostridium beijerinckii TaxID=1520 RepID=UPI00098C3C93|nr:Mur ligase family protein [Clostridium beijerinckii]NRT77402.1 UDP-N-acetylmuramyl tripeptide synthase [Clostridium beijerinckii]OOM50789.1 UDP-N-acetylmuramate--L-alanine ligase [Clostridium beijerinckii]
MSEINIKSILSILLSKITAFSAKHIVKGGSNFPGKIALKIDKSILKHVSKGYKVILVTGTNGKTTTTSMIYNILKENKLHVITNSTGANLYPGIVACFISNYSFFKKKENPYAVIEVDEANVKFITEYITPEIITVTNLFRDQLDRYGEVYTTLVKILEGVTKVPESKLVLNGDESLLGKLDVKNPVAYYGFNTPIKEDTTLEINADAKFCKFCKSPYSYNLVTYNHLGDFYCPECGYKRSELAYAVNKIFDLTPENSSVLINDTEVFISQSGAYNIYNALCAFAISKELGIEDSVIKSSLQNQSSSFGRQEQISIDNKDVQIILVKNPAGYNQALDTLALNTSEFSAVFMLNDNYADGRDVSWIWDVDFEKISSLKIEDIFVSGIRMYDMAVRLKVAGLNVDKFILKEDYEELTDKIKESASKKIYILATYTAMINYRKYLHSKGYIKKLW